MALLTNNHIKDLKFQRFISRKYITNKTCKIVENSTTKSATSFSFISMGFVMVSGQEGSVLKSWTLRCLV